MKHSDLKIYQSILGFGISQQLFKMYQRMGMYAILSEDLLYCYLFSYLYHITIYILIYTELLIIFSF